MHAILQVMAGHVALPLHPIYCTLSHPTAKGAILNNQHHQMLKNSNS